MALIKCRECDKEYSDVKEECVHCGFPRESLVPFDKSFKRSQKRKEFYNRWFKPQPVKRPSKVSQSISAVFLAIFLVAFVLAVFTKPVQSDFESHIENLIQEAAVKERKGKSELGKMWVDFKFWLGEGAVDLLSTGYYQDYYICSYYILVIGDEQLVFLGLFGEINLVDRK